MIFAKNSDHEPNEAHYLLLVPHARHEAGSSVKCTYVSIPQVAETYSVLLAKPFWIWGAEMGANECGVVIGNEALFSRAPAGKEPGLIGMDFLRLALERAGTAHTALEIIISLLELHGQGGNCGFMHPTYYHNSYLIADRTEAWVLETVDKQWAAEKVENVRSISNAITIGRTWGAGLGWPGGFCDRPRLVQGPAGF
jgi:dipeptidase